MAEQRAERVLHPSRRLYVQVDGEIRQRKIPTGVAPTGCTGQDGDTDTLWESGTPHARLHLAGLKTGGAGKLPGGSK